MNLTIAVTRKHIAEGVQADPNKCAVALAIRDGILINYQRLQPEDIMVSPVNIYIKGRRFDTPPEVARFVCRFDYVHFLRGLRLRPFIFTLE